MLSFIINLLVLFIQFIIFLFTIATPFTNNVFLLIIYIIGIPNLLLHWYFKNDICSLIIFEGFIRSFISKFIDNVSNNVADYISFKILHPIFHFPTMLSEFESKCAYLIIILLWLVSCHKLRKIYQQFDKNSNKSFLSKLLEII